MAPTAFDFVRTTSATKFEERLDSPFPELSLELSDNDLRETAYEIFVSACGVTMFSTRTVVPGAKVNGTSRLTSAAVGRMKRALKTKKEKYRDHHLATLTRGRGAPSVSEVMRYQMDITGESDARIRRALSRAAGVQVGKSVESMLVPLELLQYIGFSDFTNREEYEYWQKRQVKVLKAGLLFHPDVKEEVVGDTLSQRLKNMLGDMSVKPIETGKPSEALQALRNAAMARAGRKASSEIPSDRIHWADGFPFNVLLYQMLLCACFDTLEETKLTEEVDEVLEQIKKTWIILGINQMLHNLCFMWVLFRQFVLTGHTEVDLIGAVEIQMKEVALDARTILDLDRLQTFKTALKIMQAWSQKRLSSYHRYFKGAQGVMEGLLSMSISASQILQDIFQENKLDLEDGLSIFEIRRTESYIRSSTNAAFIQTIENLGSKVKPFKSGSTPHSTLVVLAEGTRELAQDEKDRFSAVLSRWHPYPSGVAAVTLHSCYQRQLKKFLSGVVGLTPDVVQVLQAADELEKKLVQMAVEDVVEAEDGGKGLIQEMTPFEGQMLITDFSRKWVQEGVERLMEWVDRNIQHEEWIPNATREGYAPSAVEALRIIEETLDAFFALPVSDHPELLNELVVGVDRAIQHYCYKTVSTCGNKDTYVPSIPPLTRYKKSAFKSRGGWRAGLHLYKSKSLPQDKHDTLSLKHLCVRINSLHHINEELEYVEKRLKYGWQKDAPPKGEKAGRTSFSPETTDVGSFKNARADIEEGLKVLIEVTAYKVVFFDLRCTFWEGLYSGGVEIARMSAVIEQLDPILGTIAYTSSEQLRNRVVAALMTACFGALMLVLVSGGTTRAFGIYDAEILEDDLTTLKNLFKADGDGLPSPLVDSAAAPIQDVLSLFHISTEKLIQIFKAAYQEADLSTSNRFKTAPVPPTTGQWAPTDPNTILRVLCHRGDETASKFLKKTFNLPKRP